MTAPRHPHGPRGFPAARWWSRLTQVRERGEQQQGQQWTERES